jgi:DNA-directed RNA polymerase specialized sigma24 family protein
MLYERDTTREGVGFYSKHRLYWNNDCINHVLTSKQALHSYEDELIDSITGDDIDNRLEEEEEFERKLSYSYKVLSILKPCEAKAVLLRCKGYTYQQLSEALGMSLSGAYGKYHRALTKLQQARENDASKDDSNKLY